MQEYIKPIEFEEEYIIKMNKRAALIKAREDLKKTLSAPSRKDKEDEEPEIKLNRKMTKAEARRMLKRTQAALWSK